EKLTYPARTSSWNTASKIAASRTFPRLRRTTVFVWLVPPPLITVIHIRYVWYPMSIGNDSYLIVSRGPGQRRCERTEPVALVTRRTVRSRFRKPLPRRVSRRTSAADQAARRPPGGRHRRRQTRQGDRVHRRPRLQSEPPLSATG